MKPRSLGVRAALRRIPRAAIICALVAGLNAVSWSIITPPFQAPDEPSHFAYVQELAEVERLPPVGLSSYSPQEEAVLGDLHHEEVRFQPQVHPISSPRERHKLDVDLNASLSRRGLRVGVAASQPPLYYALEIVPYGLGLAGTMLDQLALMRLLSALLCGLTALFTFLFLAEVLPRVRWAWTVGALSVALTPLLGFMSGAVNPDAMLIAVTAALFYVLARAFRRGFTKKAAVAIGAVTAIGFLSKLNFVGLVPGIFAGLLILAFRAWRVDGRREALRSLAIALGIGLAPGLLYFIGNVLSGNPALGIASGSIAGLGHGSIWRELSYIWQFYLPRLPGMGTGHFPGLLVTRDVWFNRSVGLYGWLDTSFPVWVQRLALVPAGAIVILLIRALLAGRASVKARAGELVVYLLMVIGLMGLVGAQSYLSLGNEAAGYFEPRYLLPLLPLLGGALALAARGAGRRLGPAVGAIVILLFLAHDIFSQLLVVGRYYA